MDSGAPTLPLEEEDSGESTPSPDGISAEGEDWAPVFQGGCHK